MFLGIKWSLHEGLLFWTNFMPHNLQICNIWLNKQFVKKKIIFIPFERKLQIILKQLIYT